MEVFGGMASGLAIASAAAATARLAATTFADLRDAPVEFKALRLNVRLVQNVLEEIATLLKHNQQPVPGSVRQSFHDGLDAIYAALSELEIEYKKHTEKKQFGKRAAIRWTLIDGYVVEKHERRLQTALSFFNVIISLAHMYVAP